MTGPYNPQDNMQKAFEPFPDPPNIEGKPGPHGARAPMRLPPLPSPPPTERASPTPRICACSYVR